MENTVEKLIVGYGRDRTERDFRRYGVADRYAYIDTNESERTQRAAMMQLVAVARDQGHEVDLVLLTLGDLGHGVDLKRQREKLEALGVTVIVPNEKPKRPRGRPKGSKFDPAPDHDEEIKSAWHDDGRTVQGVLNIARRHGYEDVTVPQLRGRYGNRFKQY